MNARFYMTCALLCVCATLGAYTARAPLKAYMATLQTKPEVADVSKPPLSVQLLASVVSVSPGERTLTVDFNDPYNPAGRLRARVHYDEGTLVRTGASPIHKLVQTDIESLESGQKIFLTVDRAPGPLRVYTIVNPHYLL